MEDQYRILADLIWSFLCTRVKMQIIASDRARRENVPRYILFAIVFPYSRLLVICVCIF